MIVIYLRRKKSTKGTPKTKDNGHPQKGPDTHYADLEVDSEASIYYTELHPPKDYYNSIEAAGCVHVNT